RGGGGVYTHGGPRGARGVAVAAGRCRVRPRPFPEVRARLDYHASDAVRRVAADGTVSFRGRPWRVGKAFRGERVGVRATAEDGVWAVFFGVHGVASIDLRGNNQPD